MMSLRGIHVVFIVASIALTLFVALWGISMFTSGRGGLGELAFGLGSAACGAGMGIYLAAFRRKTREIGME